MLILLSAVHSTLCSMFRSRAALLEHVALRHQIGVLKGSARKRPKLTAADCLFGFSSRGSSAAGARRWTSSNPRPRSPCWRITGAGWSTLMSRASHGGMEQLREAFPFDQIPRYLLRDRDKIFGDTFREQVKDMNIERSSITVTAGLRGPRDRFHSARVPGSCDRLRGSLLATNPVSLFLLPSPNEAASFVGKGCAGTSADPATGTGTSSSSTPSWWTAPPLRTTCSL